MALATERFRAPGRRPAPGRAEEAAIRRVIDRMVDAVRAKDVEALLRLCGPDLASFDLLPPLRHDGARAIRQLWAERLAAFEAPLDFEVNQLEIVAGTDVAFCRSLNRFGGSRGDSEPVVSWLCCTICLRKVDGQWKIVHQHVSVPFDMETGKALLHLGG